MPAICCFSHEVCPAKTASDSRYSLLTRVTHLVPSQTPTFRESYHCSASSINYPPASGTHEPTIPPLYVRCTLTRTPLESRYYPNSTQTSFKTALTSNTVVPPFTFALTRTTLLHRKTQIPRAALALQNDEPETNCILFNPLLHP